MLAGGSPLADPVLTGSLFGEAAGVLAGGSPLADPVLTGSLFGEATGVFKGVSVFEPGSLLTRLLVVEVLYDVWVEVGVVGVGVDPAAASCLAVVVVFVACAGSPILGSTVGLNGVREPPEVNGYGGS